MTRKQAIFWLLTIHDNANSTESSYAAPTELPDGLSWIVGQREIGDKTGRAHWQICCAFTKKTSRAGVLRHFGRCHAEPSRSEHAAKYCQKTETAIPGTQFEFGAKPFRRNVRRSLIY